METPWLTAFAQRTPFAEAFRSTGQNPAGTSKLRAELNELSPDEWPTRLRRLISDQISLMLRRSIDPDRPLAEYGLDSLGALELRTRIETETGFASRPLTSPPSLSAIWRGSCAKAGARGSR
jgi:polyketide synthase 5